MNKKCIVLILAVFLFAFSSCSKNGYYDGGYEDGYAAGYSDGQSDTRSEMEDDFGNGYAEGYSDGYSEAENDFEIDSNCIYSSIEEQAAEYASRKTGWSPEEAWAIIADYRAGQPIYNSFVPTGQDFYDAVDTLIYYYEYFYGGHYD